MGWTGITVDGKLSFWGTGTEDYFCDAWGLHVFSYPCHGASVVDGREVGDRLSVYRFRIADPIPFRKSFKFEIEPWPWISPWPNTGRDYFSSVNFWYQKSIHKAWPKLERIVSNEPWDEKKGRWFIAGAVEAESLKILARESSAEGNPRPIVQWEMPNLSGDHMPAFDSGGKGESSLAIPVADPGVCTIAVYYTRAQDFGEVQSRVNGWIIGDQKDVVDFAMTDSGKTKVRIGRNGEDIVRMD